MKAVLCSVCKSKMKRNGHTKAGTQRWRCTCCGASLTVHYNDTHARLKQFLGWLLGPTTQSGMKGQGRSFRRHTFEFWNYWPQPIATGEIYRVLFCDGIWIDDNLVVLICMDERYVVSWYLASSENTRAWEALIKTIPAPEVVVCDGSPGFASAVKKIWPTTQIQRCLFHVFNQIKRYTTTRPRLQAGRELYGLALELMHLETIQQAEWWQEKYLDWCVFWSDFLEEQSIVDGKRVYTHERLRKARMSLSRLVSSQTLFTYLDPTLSAEAPLPRTNNRIEGGVNAQLRQVLRNHRGLSSLRRVKAVFWWCYTHSEAPEITPEILAKLPQDKDIGYLKSLYGSVSHPEDGRPEWGDRVVWEELHHRDPYPYWLN